MKMFYVLMLCFLGVVYAHAEVIHIPDPNLERALRRELELTSDVEITATHLARQQKMDLSRQDISDLTGLEHAINLRDLWLIDNPVEDLRSLSGLVHLEYIDLSGCTIVDVSPLSDLTRLSDLNLTENRIVDIRPLENSINLKSLYLANNRIVDVRPLANLINLERLDIGGNRIVAIHPLANLVNLDELHIDQNLIDDHSPLDGLSLSVFTYDQFCEMPSLPLETRLENRSYPSTFGGEWLFGTDSRIDLLYGAHFGKMYWRRDGIFVGEIDLALQKRDQLLAMNPNMVFLVEVGMRSAYIRDLGEDWPYWVRDANGEIVPEGFSSLPAGLMDFTHPDVQDRIVKQAISVSKCGLFDGIVFDWWNEISAVLADDRSGWGEGYRGFEAEQRARDIILERIRAETRPNFLIQVNSNRSKLPRTGPYINGLSMETLIPFSYFHDSDLLEQVLMETESTLLWAEENLRKPHINGVAGQGIFTEPAHSPFNRRWVRALTTLSLTHADGYALYQREWGDWYDFLEADLGYPVGGTAQLYDEDIPGLFIREFTNGWAVYNRSREIQEITLPELVTGVESRVEGTTHTLLNYDGEMYLKAKPKDPSDVNGDGVINILDLVVIAVNFTQTGKHDADVNGDGVVNILDLVQVAGAIGGGGAAPSAYSLDPSIISAADVESWLAQAQGLGVGDANFQRGIRFLEGLLAVLTPKETALLPNYPNPFNPETWIPYRLAREAEVVIAIYDTKGTLVRRLAIGNQSAGYYAERGKAGYWDGRNEDGEAVASGIYIYQFRAGDFVASRRMVIVK